MPPLRPRALRVGDRLGVLGREDLPMFERGIRSLRELGYDVRVADVPAGSLEEPGRAKQLADALHRFLVQPETRAVIFPSGSAAWPAGWGRLVPFLDFPLIARHPCILCGFSGATAVLLAAHARTGLVTFYGPMVAEEWSEGPSG